MEWRWIDRMKYVFGVLLTLGIWANGWANEPDGQQTTGEGVAGISYVTKMALIQGHLWVAAQLVEAEEMDLGAKHAKHPQQEVYQELLPFFLQIGSSGFADELDDMAQQLHNPSKGDFRASYLRVMAVIDDIIAGQDLNDSAKLTVAQALIAQAAVEYRAGVVDGEITDLQEYQDARGFLQIAETFVAQCEESRRRDSLLEQFQSAKVLWPDLNLEGALIEDAARLSLLADQLAATGELASP